MNKTNPSVDGFIRKSKKWQKELSKLRSIILDCQLTEEVKWRVPCYTFENHNIVLMGGFKEFCCLNFVKGALIKDPKGILQRIGENTQVGRWIKFTNVEQIVELEPVLKGFIRQAIEVEKAGVKVKLKKTSDFKIPEELQTKLDELPTFKAAFTALTPGRQRGYLLYFSSAKQSKTRFARIDKCMPQIFKGKGLYDD